MLLLIEIKSYILLRDFQSQLRGCVLYLNGVRREMIFSTCHKGSSTGSTLWLGVVLFQDDPVLCEATDVCSLSYIVNYKDDVKRVYHFNCE